MSGLGRVLAVADPSNIEARLSALEVRVEEVAADAAAARHLAPTRVLWINAAAEQGGDPQVK
jgi:hypothetical protein